VTVAGLSLALPRVQDIRFRKPSPPLIAAAIAFAVLFWSPFTTLLRDWWSDPDAGHGLLLGPVALYLAWKSGIQEGARGQPRFGLAILLVAAFFRYLASLAAELFTMRASMLLAIVALVIYAYGIRQVIRWWLPFTLVALSIPLPSVVLSSLALPLQFKATQMGAALLEWRQVPLRLSGNVLQLPGRTLFVTEACSGLRSLTALLSLGVLISGIWLRTPLLRVFLILLAIPIAVLLNGVRVFLTGFLVHFVNPRLGDGFMHMTEGWVMFVIAFGMLGGLAWLLIQMERLWRPAT
jgi:exosortase